MYQKISDVTLKTGETAELGIVTGPDREWGPKISHLLGHKGDPWNWQIDQCLSRPEIGVETRCCILSRAGRPFSNISTFENHGVGIFGHVFTLPAERRKGAADILNRQVMADFKDRGGNALYLGTSYDSPAYHIYRKYGFQSVEPESGYMVYTRVGKSVFENDYFAPGPATVETLAFKHWPVLPALMMMDHPARLRVLSMGIIKAITSEEGVLLLLKQAEDKNQPPQARVAVSSKTHAPLAFACCGPDRYFGSAVDLLDVFFAPGCDAQALEVIRALEFPDDRKVVCYTDGTWAEKTRVIEAVGFVPEATLKKHLKSDRILLDITVWSRG